MVAHYLRLLADMTPKQVERLLKEAPQLLKEITLVDGRAFYVRGSEQWAAQDLLVVLDRGTYVHVAYRNIVSIGCPEAGESE